MSAVLSKYATSKDNNFNLIRFVAAFLVLYGHSFVLALGTDDAEPLRNFIGMTWGGIAVDVFFVTSGFLVTSSFLGRKSIIAFAWARILRIYPALVVAVVFCVFGVGLFFTTKTSSEYLSDPQLYEYLVKNIVLFFGINFDLPGVFVDNPYGKVVNGSLWTLHYEVIMYVLLAVIGSALVGLQKMKGGNILQVSFLGIAVLAVVVNIANHFHLFAPFRLVHLFSMFFVGVSFYVWRERVVLSSKMFFVLLVMLFVSVVDNRLLCVAYSLFMPYLLFYVAYIPAGFIRKFNGAGDYSYGIYIYAFPVQQSIAVAIPDVSVLAMVVISFSISLFLAFMSWHFVEKNFLKLKSNYLSFDQLVRKFCLTISCARPR